MANVLLDIFKQDSLSRSLIILIVMACCYTILVYNFDFVQNKDLQDVLKQLLGFTSLVVSIIYAVLIPRIFFEREQSIIAKNELLTGFKKILALQQFYHSIWTCINAWETLTLGRYSEAHDSNKFIKEIILAELNMPSLWERLLMLKRSQMI